MNLDLSECKTAEDVQKIFKESGFRKQVAIINRKLKKAKTIYKFIHHEDGFVTRELA